VWNGKTFEAKPQEWWERYEVSELTQAQIGSVIRVADFDGPTTVTDRGVLTIQRGCIICGHRLIAQRVRPFAKHRGGLCLSCIAVADKYPSPADQGLLVSVRLTEEGMTGDWKPIRRVPIKGTTTGFSEEEFRVRGWRRLLWADRVKRSANPAIQEPPSRAFGYLSGPVRVTDVEEVNA
jgi:hypothetical protein